MKHNSTQLGQTLIETMVAAVVLVMGISAAVALSIYGLGATTSVTKQFIAVGLAREGIEAVKNMRDTNWLKQGPSVDCYDYFTDIDRGVCYKEWLNNGRGYQIDPGATATYSLGFDISGSSPYWSLIETDKNFGLDYNPTDLQYGIYSSNGRSVLESSSGFGRKITLTTDTFEPFNHATDLGPRLKVTVDVWWTDKRCPASDDVSSGQGCKVTLETYLTNWKNY